MGLLKGLDPRERWILFELNLAGIQQCLGALMKTKCEADWAPVFGGGRNWGTMEANGTVWDGDSAGVEMGCRWSPAGEDRTDGVGKLVR